MTHAGRVTSRPITGAATGCWCRLTRPRFKASPARRLKSPNRRVSWDAPLSWPTLPAPSTRRAGPAAACVRDRRAGHRQELAGRCVSSTSYASCARCGSPTANASTITASASPILPLIEALTRLAGAPDGAVVKKILAAQAPSWLAQMLAVDAFGARYAGTPRARATRERAAARADPRCRGYGRAWAAH